VRPAVRSDQDSPSTLRQIWRQEQRRTRASRPASAWGTRRLPNRPCGYCCSSQAVVASPSTKVAACHGSGRPGPRTFPDVWRQRRRSCAYPEGEAIGILTLDGLVVDVSAGVRVGIAMQAWAPPSGWLAMRTVPPWLWAMALTMARPSPAPCWPLAGSARPKRSKA